MPADAPLPWRERVPLAPLTTLGVGGPARWLAAASTPADVAAAYDQGRRERVPIFLLAGGSNVVIADDGFPGLVVQMGIRGTSFEADGATTLLTAGAGEPWDPLVSAAVSRGLAGIECLSGIPGTVGGTPIQNVGAYGQDVAETIQSVTAFDITRHETVTLAAADCGFSYRTSRFKSDPGRFIVTAVTFRLRPGTPQASYPDLRAWLEEAGIDRPALTDVRTAVLAVRRSKGMVVDSDDPDSRSVGSFFTNPIVTPSVRDAIARSGGAPPAYPAGERMLKIPAAWLIERSGFRKGYVDGAVGISSKHPLALVNRGGATARDVLRLAVRIKRQVANRFGVPLKPEPIFVGFGDDPDVTYLVKD